MQTPDLQLLRKNRLLALLGEPTLALLARDMRFAAMRAGDLVMEEDRPIREAWFPTDGVISMLGASRGAGSRVEVGTIGNEGMAGLALFLGRDRAHGECYVQVAGHALRMPGAAFQAAAGRDDLTQVLHRYTHALFVQAAQGTACNLTHSPLQRCARWLLMTDDRVEGDSFDLKQEFLAQMIGERRPTVSRVESTLQARGIIAYSRGRVTVLDRKGLEDTACACYRVIRDEYDTLLQGPHRSPPPSPVDTRSVRKRT